MALIKGINPYITNADYHADKEWLSSSKLKLLFSDTEKFKKEVIDGESTPLTGDFLDEGSAVHTMALEPGKFDEEYAIFNGFAKKGKLWEEFKEANKGKIVLSTPQHVRVQRYYKSIMRQKAALPLLSGGIAEHTMCTELQGVKVKARCDYIIPDKGIIIDIKTTSKPAGLEMFKLTVNQYSYQLSAALYSQVAYDLYRKNFDFYFIVVSKSDLKTDVYKLSLESAAIGHNMVNKALVKYKKCVETGNWADNKIPLGLQEETDDEYKIEEV